MAGITTPEGPGGADMWAGLAAMSDETIEQVYLMLRHTGNTDFKVRSGSLRFEVSETAVRSVRDARRANAGAYGRLIRQMVESADGRR